MTRYLHSMFCDDIRHEVGGKTSYTGVYTSKLLVPSFPVLVPKLCLVITAVTSADTPFKKFSIRILKDDTILIEQSLTDANITQGVNALSDLPKHNSPERIQVLNLSLVFSPFPIEGPCVLRVRGETENGELRGPGLIIEQTPATQ